MKDMHIAVTVIIILVISIVGLNYHYQKSIHQYDKTLEQDLTLESNQREDFQALMGATNGACTDATCVSNPVNCVAFKVAANVQQCQLTEQAVKAGY